MDAIMHIYRSRAHYIDYDAGRPTVGIDAIYPAIKPPPIVEINDDAAYTDQSVGRAIAYYSV